MKSLFKFLSIVGLILLLTNNSYAQNTGTPSQIRVKVDANNYLILIAAAQTSPVSNPTVFNNIRLKTDSSNQLYVVVTGNITPTTITCSSSVGTTSTVLVGGTPCTWSSTPGILGRSSASTFYWESPNFTNTAGCPLCGFPATAYGRFDIYDGTAGGLQIGSMANSITNPAMRFVAIGGQWSGVGNPVTSPVVQFSLASGNAGGGIIGSVGYLYEWTNSISGAPDLARWCYTTEAAIASCTTDYGGGNPDRYLYDWSLNSTSLMQVSRLNVKSTTTFGGNITALTDNSFDIGASGATRPRTVYVGTSYVGPLFNATSTYQVNGVLSESATAPTIASGGCTSPAVTSNNGTTAFLITIGSSCTGIKTFTLTLPVAAHFWVCDGNNNTSDAQQQSNYIVPRATSTTAVIVTSYDRVTGLQEDFTAADTYLMKCKAE